MSNGKDLHDNLGIFNRFKFCFLRKVTTKIHKFKLKIMTKLLLLLRFPYIVLLYANE